MLIHNARLTSTHPYSSHPITWPFVVRGISYWETKTNWRQIYVLGNPLIWWTTIAGVALFGGLYIMDLLLLRRGVDEFGTETRRWWIRTTGFLSLAWACHYIPFFLMGRQLFLHHYMPAFIFSTLVLATLVDFIFRVSLVTAHRRGETGMHWNARRFGGFGIWVFVVGVLTVFTISFWYFSPLSYGTPFDELESLERRKWFKSWDIQHARK